MHTGPNFIVLMVFYMHKIWHLVWNVTSDSLGWTSSICVVPGTTVATFKINKQEEGMAMKLAQGNLPESMWDWI